MFEGKYLNTFLAYDYITDRANKLIIRDKEYKLPKLEDTYKSEAIIPIKKSAIDRLSM